MDIAENSVEQRDLIVQQLREAGCRITKQRLVVLDIIFLNQILLRDMIICTYPINCFSWLNYVRHEF